MPASPTRDGPRVNEEIRAAQVRLIDEEGEMQGVMTARDALLRAYNVGLDLLEISPNAEPPVVKILDFGKYKYEQQKKKNEAKKKQKVIEIKEIKVRPNIDENDYQVKMRAMKSFIEEGDKVKVTLRFRGREMAHQDIGVRVLERIRTEMDPLTKVEQMPRMENRQMVMVLSPREAVRVLRDAAEPRRQPPSRPAFRDHCRDAGGAAWVRGAAPHRAVDLAAPARRQC
jgi:translation initiation factor IF-3